MFIKQKDRNKAIYGQSYKIFLIHIIYSNPRQNCLRAFIYGEFQSVQREMSFILSIRIWDKNVKPG